jgi:hypothetical protein
MDFYTLLTILVTLLGAVGIKEFWKIWEKKLDIKAANTNRDETSKDALTVKVIEELRKQIMILESKIDTLTSENIALREKLARMEERIIISATSNSNKKQTKNEQL